VITQIEEIDEGTFRPSLITALSISTEKQAGGPESMHLDNLVSSPPTTARCSRQENCPRRTTLFLLNPSQSTWKQYLPSLLLLHPCLDRHRLVVIKANT
jgi:hypothetical protein